MSNHNSAKYFTRGGQIMFHNLRMLFQINRAVGKMYMLSLLLLTVAVGWAITPKEVYINAYYWVYSLNASWLKYAGIKEHLFNVPYNGHIYLESAQMFLTIPQLIAKAKEIYVYAGIALGIAFVLSMIVSYFFIKWLTKKGREQAQSKVIRGATIDTPSAVAKKIKKNNVASDIILGSVPLLKDSETQHILMHGTTGAGKTTLILQLLRYLRKRGDKVILYDKGCVYTELMLREGKDKLLNAYDQRCENWDLWAEALDAPDFENMAESLIPMHGETDPFWVDAARTIFGSAAYTMQDDNDRSISKLLRLLLTSELADLEKYLKGTEAAILTSDKIEKTAISIRSVLTTYLKSMRFLYGLDNKGKKKFSIRDWIHQDDNSWLFISSNAEQHGSLRPLISMWLAMASTTLLSLPEDRNRRIWFICDELPSLHKLPLLPETIAEARKFGGCFLLGMQSQAQLEKVYGRNGSREMFDLLNTQFYFRSPSAEMARLVAKELGEQEIEDTRENYSYGANKIRDGISVGTQRLQRDVVYYPEIMELADLKCFLKLPGKYPVCKLDLEFIVRERLSTGFIKRDISGDKEIEEVIKQNEGKVIKQHMARKHTNENTSDAKEKTVTVSTDIGMNKPKSKVVENEIPIKKQPKNNNISKEEPV